MNKLLYTEFDHFIDDKVITLVLCNNGSIVEAFVTDADGDFLGIPEETLVSKLAKKLHKDILEYCNCTNVTWTDDDEYYSHSLNIHTGIVYNPDFGATDLNITINEVYL